MSKDILEHFGEQLRNHEVTPSSRVSFDAVMEKREKKKRRILFWWQLSVMTSLVLGTLGVYQLKNNEPNELKSNTAISQFSSHEEIEDYINHSEHATEGKPIPKPATAYKSLNSEPPKNKQVEPNSVKGVKELPKKQKNNTGIFGVFETFNKQRKQIFTTNSKADKSLAKSARSNAKTAAISMKQGGVADLKLQPFADENASVMNSGVSPMALSNVYDFGAKKYINRTQFNLNINFQSDDYIDWELKNLSRSDRYLKLPWYAELSAITGSNNQIQFDSKEPISILGTNYMAQYQLSFLKEFGGGDLWGLGIQYTQWVGNGEWRKQEWIQEVIVDSQQMAVNIPGLPTQFYTQYDTVKTMQNQVTTGSISYNIDKWALPISHRGFFQLLKTQFRYAAQIAPGITRSTKGVFFTPTEYAALEQKHRFSLGAKVALGPIIPVGNGVTIALEPALMYQSFMHQNKGLKGNFFGGFGISMMWRLK